MNAQLAAPMRVALEELGHPQPSAAMKAGSAAPSGITNGTVRQQRSKAIGMRFYWLKDREEQGQSKFFWADYFTKHHPPTHPSS